MKALSKQKHLRPIKRLSPSSVRVENNNYPAATKIGRTGSRRPVDQAAPLIVVQIKGSTIAGILRFRLVVMQPTKHPHTLLNLAMENSLSVWAGAILIMEMCSILR